MKGVADFDFGSNFQGLRATAFKSRTLDNGVDTHTLSHPHLATSGYTQPTTRAQCLNSGQTKAWHLGLELYPLKRQQYCSLSSKINLSGNKHL